MDAATLQGYDEKGYLSIESLVTPDEVEAFRAELRRLSEDPTVRADERTIVERDRTYPDFRPAAITES
jgi:ectoine hydroxylase